MDAAPQLDSELLAILRCPVAIREIDSADPGKLELVRDGWWLHAADSGCSYPIRDGLPHMLPEEGLRWREVPVADLPVPPPSGAEEESEDAESD